MPLVVFAAGATVYAVRPGGDVDWRFEAKGKVFTAPALADDGSVLFGSQDHHVYALSPQGALAWSVDLGADVDGAPAIADDGAIVVGTDAGEVVRLRGSSGEVLSRAQVGGFVRGTLSIARNGDTLAGVYGPAPRVVRVAPDGTVRASFAIQGTGAREFGVHGGPLEDARGAIFFGAQDDDVHALGPDGLWRWEHRNGRRRRRAARAALHGGARCRERRRPRLPLRAVSLLFVLFIREADGRHPARFPQRLRGRGLGASDRRRALETR